MLHLCKTLSITFYALPQCKQRFLLPRALTPAQRKLEAMQTLLLLGIPSMTIRNR